MDLRILVATALAGRSIHWLANKSGVPNTTLHDWLRAGRNINSVSMGKVLHALGAKLIIPIPKELRPAISGDWFFRAENADASWIGATVRMAGGETVERSADDVIGKVIAVDSPNLVRVIAIP